jgi:hypothetical protein
LTISTRFFPSILFFNRLQVIQVFSIGFIVIWRKFPKAAFFCPFIFLRFARDLAMESCTVSIFFFFVNQTFVSCVFEKTQPLTLAKRALLIPVIANALNHLLAVL